MKALIFAIDPTESDLARHSLQYVGIDTVAYANMDLILDNWGEHASDLVVLAADETFLPLQTVKRIRETTQTPLLVISDSMTESHLCEVLQAGADLILTRPVSQRLMINYAQVLLRRADTVPQSFLSSFESDEFVLDSTTRTVSIHNKEPQRLTRLEFRLLYVLVANREQVVPIEVLIERVWGYNSDGDHELVRGLISRVRRKVEPDPQHPQFIENLPGVGYRFTTEISSNK